MSIKIPLFLECTAKAHLSLITDIVAKMWIWNVDEPLWAKTPQVFSFHPVFKMQMGQHWVGSGSLPHAEVICMCWGMGRACVCWGFEGGRQRSVGHRQGESCNLLFLSLAVWTQAQSRASPWHLLGNLNMGSASQSFLLNSTSQH